MIPIIAIDYLTKNSSVIWQLPFELLFRKFQETPPNNIGYLHYLCLPELTQHTLETGLREIQLELPWKLTPLGLAHR